MRGQTAVCVGRGARDQQLYIRKPLSCFTFAPCKLANNILKNIKNYRNI